MSGPYYAQPIPEPPRSASGYHPDWDLDLAMGVCAEQSVARQLCIETCTVEVKTERHWGSGNTYVETHQRHPGGEWQPSGILITRSDLWAVVMGAVTTLYPTSLLRAALNHPGAAVRPFTYTVGERHTQGMLMNMAWLQAHQNEL